MGKIKVLTLVLTKLDIELGLAQPQLVYLLFAPILGTYTSSLDVTFLLAIVAN